VCDDFVALLGDEQVRDLPGGVEEYLERRRILQREAEQRLVASAAPPTAAKSSAARDREIQKAQSRLERQIDKLRQREGELHQLLTEHATDYEKVSVLNEELREVESRRDVLEDEWLTLVD
jgi:ATP-binding cassette subfamily F protein uup